MRMKEEQGKFLSISSYKGLRVIHKIKIPFLLQLKSTLAIILQLNM